MFGRIWLIGMVAGLAAALSIVGLSPVQPAHAAVVQLTLKVAPATIADGDLVTLSGKARNAKVGTTVKLQHREAGSWVTLTTKKVKSDRLYSFKRRPTGVGTHKFRILMTRQLGQARATSPAVAVKVLHRTVLSVSVSRSDGLYAVSGSASAAAPAAIVHFEAFLAGSWTEQANAPANLPFEFSVPYPHDEPLRLRVDGDTNWMPLIRPVPYGGVIRFAPALNAATAVVDTLTPLGHDVAFTSTVEEGELYSVGLTAPFSLDSDWSATNNSVPMATFQNIPRLFETAANGSATFAYSALNHSLGGSAVTIWKTLERTLSAPATVMTVTGVGQGRFVNLELLSVTCNSSILDITVTSGDPLAETEIWMDGPNDRTDHWTVNGSLTHQFTECASGDWKLLIRRSDTSVGPLEVSYVSPSATS